jgi:hypothetical protein
MQTYARVITDDPTDKELDYWSGKRGDRSNVSVRLAKGCCEMAYFRLNRNGEKRGQVKCIRSFYCRDSEGAQEVGAPNYRITDVQCASRFREASGTLL